MLVFQAFCNEIFAKTAQNDVFLRHNGIVSLPPKCDVAAFTVERGGGCVPFSHFRCNACAAVSRLLSP